MARRYIEDVTQRLYEQSAFYEGLSQQSPNYERYAKLIALHEGFIPKARVVEQEKTKRDGTRVNEPDSTFNTIAYGHLMDPEVSRKIFRQYLPGISWDDVNSGKRELTEDEGIKLLLHDTKRKVDEAFRLWPTFKDHRLPQQIRDLGISLWYQGSFTKSPSKGSPGTMALIDKALDGEESWGAAALEMLNRKSYIERGKRDKNNYNGVATRHEEMALALWSLDPPELRDYDLPTAIDLDLGQRISDIGGAHREGGTFHFPSRVPQSGLILKDIEHKTFALGLDEEVSLHKNAIYWDPTTERIFSLKPKVAPAEYVKLAWDAPIRPKSMLEIGGEEQVSYIQEEERPLYTKRNRAF